MFAKIVDSKTSRQKYLGSRCMKLARILACVFPHKARIADSVHIRKKLSVIVFKVNIYSNLLGF